MARKIPGSAPGTINEFVPASFGNRADPDPVKVYIRTPSQSEKRDHLVDIMQRVSMPAGDGGISIDFADIHERMGSALSRWVERVEGYKDASGSVIATGADLWERGEHLFASEVYTEIERMLGLDGEEKKDLSESPGSSQSETSPSSGAAPTADAEDSTSDATVPEPPAISSDTSQPQG